MPAWPSTLPAPVYDGYELAPVDPSIRTDMEVGSSRTRRRTAARNDKISLMWKFTDAQMAIFRAWFDNPAEAAGGSAWFDMTIAVGTTGLDAKVCRFAGIWKAVPRPGLNWIVTAQVEVR